MRQVGDNLIQVIPVDYREHRLNKLFSLNCPCFCTEDQTAIHKLNGLMREGLFVSRSHKNS